MSTREERWPAFDRAVGRTIADADWVAMFRRERPGGASALALQLRAAARAEAAKKILDLTIRETQSRETGKLNQGD